MHITEEARFPRIVVSGKSRDEVFCEIKRPKEARNLDE